MFLWGAFKDYWEIKPPLFWTATHLLTPGLLSPTASVCFQVLNNRSEMSTREGRWNIFSWGGGRGWVAWSVSERGTSGQNCRAVQQQEWGVIDFGMCFNTERRRRALGYSCYSCIYASGGSSSRCQALFDYAALLRGHRATLCLHISQVVFLGVWQFFSMTGCQQTFFLPSVQRRRISKASKSFLSPACSLVPIFHTGKCPRFSLCCVNSLMS